MFQLSPSLPPLDKWDHVQERVKQCKKCSKVWGAGGGWITAREKNSMLQNQTPCVAEMGELEKEKQTPREQGKEGGEDCCKLKN